MPRNDATETTGRKNANLEPCVAVHACKLSRAKDRLAVMNNNRGILIPVAVKRMQRRFYGVTPNKKRGTEWWIARGDANNDLRRTVICNRDNTVSGGT